MQFICKRLQWDKHDGRDDTEEWYHIEPAVYFENEKIAFLFSKMLLELPIKNCVEKVAFMFLSSGMEECCCDQCCSGTRSSIPDPVREPDFLDRDRIAIQFEKPWIGTVRNGDSLGIFRTNPITRIEAFCLYASGNH